MSVQQLSKRQMEVIRWALSGKSNKQIASQIGVSERTVEYHLKNIYAIYQVNSRIELILKLGNTTGEALFEKMGTSTVANGRQIVENEKYHSPFWDWDISFINKELDMKTIFSRHVLLSLLLAWVAELIWAVFLSYDSGYSFSELAMPMGVVVLIVGLLVGYIAKRNQVSFQRTAFGAFTGTAISPFLVIPIMLAIVIPLGKVVEMVGWLDSSTIPPAEATLLATIIMTAICAVCGAVIGTIILFVSVKRPEKVSITQTA